MSTATSAHNFEPGGTSSSEAEILGKASGVVDFYFQGRHLWNPARGLTAALIQSVAEYESRFLVELIQNGYDALDGATNGKIRIVLDEDEGSSGVLYVANTGSPFTRSNFHAICEFAQSDKNPGQSVGNKGVGFKSVLTVSTQPEVFSGGNPGGERFDGYCFRFATADDMLDLVDGDEAKAAELKADVSPYFLPIPLRVQPPSIARFAADGFVTVIRLPLEDDDALRVARKEISNLRDSGAPIHLFLSGLSTLELTTQAGGVANETVLTRDQAVRQEDLAGTIEEVDLGVQGRWLVSTVIVAEEDLQHALVESVNVRLLDPRWATDWSGDAHVSAAVRLDGGPTLPLYYTYLPMGEECVTPFRGCVHAPFSTKLARTELSDKIPLNRLFLAASARSVVKALRYATQDDVVVKPEVLVDLIGWETAHADRLLQAMRADGLDPVSAELIPAAHKRGARDRVGLASVYAWDETDLSEITASRLMSCTDARFLPDLDRSRVDKLDKLARHLGRAAGLTPDNITIADWAEAVATYLVRRKFRRQSWEAFYEDVATLLGDDPEAVRDRKIIVGDDGALHFCAPQRAEDVSRPIVFFPAARESGASEDDALLDVRVPRQLKRRIVWVNRELRWLDAARRATPARQFLEGKRLVRPFDRRSLVEQIGRVMAAAKSTTTFGEILNFAFVLHSGSEGARLDFRGARLRVPAKAGWITATTAYFSAAWSEESGEALEKLIALGGPVSSEIAAVEKALLVAPKLFPVEVKDRRAWAGFLREAGVRVGLTPVALERRRPRYEAREIWPASLGKRLGLSDAAIETWQAAHSSEGGPRPDGYTKDYATRDNIWRLPGADDYSHFDHEARIAFAAVVLHSAPYWAEHHWRITFFRPNYPAEPGSKWPTPLSAFLSETDWIPILEPTDPDLPHFEPPRRAWHFQTSARNEPPRYLPVVLHSIRGLIDKNNTVLNRLKRLGLRVWGDDAHIGARLAFLGRLLHEKRVPAKPPLTFDKAYREALAAAASTEGQNPFVGTAHDDQYVVVSRSGTAVAIRAGEHEGPPIYVAERGRKLSSRLVQLLPVDVVWVERNEAPVAAMLRHAFGPRIRQASEAKVELRVDGAPFESRPDDRRLIEGREWLALIVALTLDLKESAFEHRGERAQREALDRLRTVRLREAGEVRLTIDEREVTLPKHLSSAYPHSDPSGPYLIVPAGSDDELGIEDLEAMAPSLADAIGIGTVGDDLQASLIQLSRQLGSAADIPSDAAIARAFGTLEDYVSQVRADLAGDSRFLARLLLPLLVLVLGDAARPVSMTSSRLADGPRIRAFLEEYAGQLPRSPEEMIELCMRVGNLDQLRDELSLDFAQLNAVLRELGDPYTPIHHEKDHEQAMAWFVSEHHEVLLAAIRSRFVEIFDAGGSLAEYLEIKTLAGLGADPAWLDIVAMPTGEMMQKRMDDWLAANSIPSALEHTLEPLDELQLGNRRFVEDEANRLRLLVSAWTRKRRESLPKGLEDPTWSHEFALATGAEGWFDFRRLDARWVMERLVLAGVWPSAMPQETEAEKLGLTTDDLEKTKNEDQEERVRKEREKRSVVLDGVPFMADEDQLALLADAVAAAVSPSFLATPVKPAKLGDAIGGSGGGGGGKGGSGGSGRQPTDAQKRAIGLAGERAVFEWLKEQYPGLGGSAWRSTYRSVVFGDAAGDDDLGYDFEIPLAKKRLLYEVKSTQSADLLEFALGPSQVRMAQEAAAHPRRSEFWVLYVRNVLVSEERSLLLLPNPFSRDGARFLRNVGRGLTYRFTLGD